MDVTKLGSIEQEALNALSKASSTDKLEELRIKYLGRKSQLAQFLRSVKELKAEEKKKVGQLANDIRKKIDLAIKEKGLQLQQSVLDEKIANERIDISAPGKNVEKGTLNPLTIARQDIENIFAKMGFDVIEGSEVESDWYNFHVLNMGDDHPARDMQDTFWLKMPAAARKDPKRALLPRTHTSATQVRFMESHQPPFSIIVPGRIFRNEATDATHEMQFHQFEGLMVGKDISVAHMKGVIQHFFNEFFKEKLQFRFVSSYFPYTEPSVEIFIKGSKGKLKGKWLEVAGAGMVHQNVFKNAGYIPGEWQGFAWGFGIDRLAMLKYKIEDIRLFYSGDLRFLKQF